MMTSGHNYWIMEVTSKWFTFSWRTIYWTRNCMKLVLMMKNKHWNYWFSFNQLFNSLLSAPCYMIVDTDFLVQSRKIHFIPCDLSILKNHSDLIMISINCMVLPALLVRFFIDTVLCWNVVWKHHRYCFSVAYLIRNLLLLR